MQTNQAAVTRPPVPLARVRLMSCLFMGLGQILYLKNYLLGAVYAAIEVLTLLNLPGIIAKIGGLITLGTENLALPVTQRDHSIFMMIDGILVISVLLLVAILYVVSVKSTVSDYKLLQRSGRELGRQRMRSNLVETAFFGVAMSPTMILLVVFVLVPLIFSFLVAFTDYSSPNHLPPANIVNWVGFANFKDLFGRDANFSTALVHTAIWTLAWGVLATLTCCPVITKMAAFWDAMDNASCTIWDCDLTGDELKAFVQNELDTANETILNS